MERDKVYCGDALTVLKTFPDESVDCCITSPPYWGLRDYKTSGQLGLESTPELYVEHLVEVFRGVRRVLKKEGTLWLNLGDSYGSGTRKSLPPQSIAGHYRDELGQNADRSKHALPAEVKTINWHSSCNCNSGDPIPAIVLDPFFGAGTTGLVAKQLGRDFIGIELKPEYCKMAEKRIGSFIF